MRILRASCCAHSRHEMGFFTFCRTPLSLRTSSSVARPRRRLLRFEKIISFQKFSLWLANLHGEAEVRTATTSSVMRPNPILVVGIRHRNSLRAVRPAAGHLSVRAAN